MSSVQFAIIQTVLALTVGIIAWFTPEITAWFKKKLKRKPKYKVGQKVRVKRLTHIEKYGKGDDKLTVYRNMIQYGGGVVTIAGVYNEGLFINILEDDDQDTWHVEMFEPLNITKQNAFEALLHGHINDEEYKKIMKVKK